MGLQDKFLRYPKTIINTKAIFIVFIVIIFLYMAVSYKVLSKSNVLYTYDSSGVATYSWLIYDQINRAGMIATFINFFRLDGCCPPLHYFIQAAAWCFLSKFKLLPFSANWAIILTSSLYLLILLFSTYGIGKIIFSHKVGLLSAFLVLMLPVIFGHTRVIMRDFSMASMTPLAVYLLLKTKNFSSVKFSLLAGLGFGLATLTKESAFVFILPPLVYYVCSSLNSRNKFRVVKNFLLFLLPFGIIAGGIYLREDPKRLWFVYYVLKYQPIKSVCIPSYYIRQLPVFAGPYILFLCLPLILSYFINIKKRNKIFLFWLLIPFIGFSSSSNQGIRYMLPFAAPFCLIAAQELFSNPFFRRIKIYIPVVIVAAIVQYVMINYGVLLKSDDIESPPSERGMFCVYKATHYDAAVSLFELLSKESKDNKLDLCCLFNAFEVREMPRVYDYTYLELMFRNIPFHTEYPFDTYVDYTDCRDSFAISWRMISNIPAVNYVLITRKRSAFIPLYHDLVHELVENGSDHKAKEFIKENIKLRDEYVYFIENIGLYMFDKYYKDKFKLITKINLTDEFDLEVYKRIPG